MTAGAPCGLLLSRDLIFTAKIIGTARELGHRVLVVGDARRASDIITENHPRVVFADLTAGDLVATACLLALRQQAGPGVPFIAFGPHIDTEALAAASAAGCDLVLPRSKFSATLPELIQSYLGGAS